MVMILEKLLSMQEAADTLGVTKKTLLEHVKQGRIAFVNLGTGTERVSRKFRPSDLAAFVQAQRQVCPSTEQRIAAVKRRRRIGTTSNSMGVDLRVLLAQQASEKRSA